MDCKQGTQIDTLPPTCTVKRLQNCFSYKNKLVKQISKIIILIWDKKQEMFEIEKTLETAIINNLENIQKVVD